MHLQKISFFAQDFKHCVCLKPIYERVYISIYAREYICDLWCFQNLLVSITHKDDDDDEEEVSIAGVKARWINKSGLKEYYQDKQS